MREIVYLVIAWLSLAISLVTLGIELWALLIAALLPAEGYHAAGKGSKPVWVAVLTGIVALNVLFSLSPMGMWGLVAVIVAGVFLADVKPAVQELLQNSSRRGKGPLGLW